MERSPSIHSPDAQDSRPSFRKPAIEVSRRNYRRHSPSSSHSSPDSRKRDRSPSRHEDGILKRGRNSDTDWGKGREDGRFTRATDVSQGYGSYGHDRHGRAEGYDHNFSRRYSSYHDRSYQNSRYDDGRYAKRTADKLTRERNADDTGYRRRDERDRDERMRDARWPDRDKFREDEPDVRDKYKSKDSEIHQGQDRYAERYRDDGSDIDAQQSRLGKRINNGTGYKDAVASEGRHRDTEKADIKEVLKNKADIEAGRHRERGRRGRDDSREQKLDKGEGDGHRSREKAYKGNNEHRKGSKGYSSDEFEDADGLSQEILPNQIRGKKVDKDKKYSNEKGRPGLPSVEQLQGQKEVGGTSDHLDETERLDDNLKGSKWAPEADHSDSTAASSDPEVAKMAAMKAAALVNINLGGFKSVDEKRKMLWGGKEQKPVAASGTNRWDTVQFADRDRQEKFNKLMGVKEGIDGGQENTNDTFTTEQQKTLQHDLEKQFTAGLRRRDGRTVGLGL